MPRKIVDVFEVPVDGGTSRLQAALADTMLGAVWPVRVMVSMGNPEAFIQHEKRRNDAIINIEFLSNNIISLRRGLKTWCLPCITPKAGNLAVQTFQPLGANVNPLPAHRAMLPRREN